MSISHIGNRLQRRAAVKYLKEKNKQYGDHLTYVAREDWPANSPPDLLLVMRSNAYLVQIHAAPSPAKVRLSIIRSSIIGNQWSDGIGWNDLQELKRQAGYGDALAVEVYPPAVDVVNVANMRHLWILDEDLDLPFVWRRAPTRCGDQGGM